MMDSFLLGLSEIMHLYVLLALVGGAMTGLIVGAIPGLGPGMAIAILLPVSFGMEPLVGLTLLLGVYAGSWYGGGHSGHPDQHARNGCQRHDYV